jgi:hypothetical protein
MEVCKYCNNNEAIENSHLIPKSIYDWLKTTAPSPYIRSTHNPNQRVQDGIKPPLLCTECEVKFSQVEEIFYKNYFTKVANYRKPCPDELPISSDVLKCIYIIAWRVLADSFYFPRDNEYTEEEFNKFPLFLEEIKSAIESESYFKFKTHIIPCREDVLRKLDFPQIEWHIYERSITAEPRIWNDWERFIVYIQIPFSIIVFEVVSNESDEWQGSLVAGETDFNISEIQSVPDYLKSIVNMHYKKFEESRLSLSKTQVDILSKVAEKMDPNCGASKTMKKQW